MIRILLSLVAIPLAATVAIAQQPEKLPPGATLKSVEVRPDRIDLKSPFDYRQMLITGILESGERVDVTRLAQFKAPAQLVKISARGQVRPLGDGAGNVEYAVLGKTGGIPVQVSGQKEKYP